MGSNHILIDEKMNIPVKFVYLTSLRVVSVSVSGVSKCKRYIFAQTDNAVVDINAQCNNVNVLLLLNDQR